MRRLSLCAVVFLASSAHAEPTSGVDAVLFRSSYDANGIFGVEGARLMPSRDLAVKVLLGYARSPIDAAVPGIGGASNAGTESILDYVVTLDMTFGMSVTDKLAIGLDVGAYRTATDIGYGERGRYQTGGVIARPSTGLVSLRSLSNIDQSADPNDPAAYLGDGLSGPLDVRLGVKYGLYQAPAVAVALIGSVVLPFGDDFMLLGDRDLVYEPKLALEWRGGRKRALRVVGNLGARFRNRAVLEGYDTADPMATADDAKVFLDVGSEVIAGAGVTYELTPRATVALEAQGFVPLPTTVGYGKCTRFNGLSCTSIDADDYWQGAQAGDLAALVTLGMMVRVSTDVTATMMVGSGPVGVRGDDVRVTTGLMWAPQPEGASAPGRHDRDRDGIPDAVDACSDEPEDVDRFADEDGCADRDNDGDGIGDGDDSCPNDPEDKDGFRDQDGCPEPDNDDDGVPDAADKCPNEGEDTDGWQDDDGCPDPDNDGDGVPDAADKCPNDRETINGVDDDDGCPDMRATNAPEERADRIDLKGQSITFDKQSKLTPATRALLAQVAAIIKNGKLTIRIEVHVARVQKLRDRQLAQQRARAIRDYIASQGVLPTQLQIVGVGSDRPLAATKPTDPLNNRVDLIKLQPGGVP